MTDRVAQARPATQRGTVPLLLAIGASLVIHGALVAAVVRLPSRPLRNRPTTVAVDIVEMPRTPPPPAATRAPPPRQPEPRRVVPPHGVPPRASRTPAPSQPAQRPEPLPPPPNAPAAEEQKPGPVRFGVSMSSTTAAGTYSAPVGNSGNGSPPQRASDPSQARPYRTERYAPPTEVSTLPVPIRVDLPKSEYPPDALREGIEGSVRLRLVVGEDGTVRDVTVVNDPGHGFGAAAARAARRWFRFRPALKDGLAVATEIPFTVEFQIQ